jgi:hypothetical protein
VSTCLWPEVNDPGAKKKAIRAQAVLHLATMNIRGDEIQIEKWMTPHESKLCFLNQINNPQ